MEPKKNPNIDSEDIKSRTVYVLSGLVLVVAFILCLVEYKKIDLAGASIESSLTALEDEEVVEINPNTPPPPPPPPPPPAPPEEVEVLEEDDEREETQEIIIEQEADVVIVVEEEEDEGPVVEEIFDVVEEMPEFPGGAAKLYEYLGKNIKYPEMAKENGIQGKVFVKFTVMSDGKIKNVEVVRGVHKTLDNEALKVVKDMPKWTPGKQRGKAVNCNFTIPIKFKIS